MGHAVWCDAEEGGHALDERKATVVSGLRLGTFHYCGPHNQDAWLKAISIAATEGKCGFLFPPVGDLTLICHKPVTKAPATADPSPVAG